LSASGIFAVVPIEDDWHAGHDVGIGSIRRECLDHVILPSTALNSIEDGRSSARWRSGERQEVEAMDFHNVVRLPSESTLVMRHVSLATVYWQDGCGALW